MNDITIFGITHIFHNHVNNIADITKQNNQISTDGRAYAWYARDSDATTCAMTGWHTAPWWKLNLGQPMKLVGASFTGKSPANQSDWCISHR